MVKKMESLRNILDIRPITIAKYYQKLVNIPRFSFQKIFNKNFLTLHKIKGVLAIDELAYVGRCIIDLSKTFDFHYNYIKGRLGEKVKLLFTDTDTFDSSKYLKSLNF